jgi:hypothetical protein
MWMEILFQSRLKKSDSFKLKKKQQQKTSSQFIIINIMDNKQKHKRKMKLAFLQENMEIMSEFDQKIHEDFMFRSQTNDINDEIKR